MKQDFSDPYYYELALRHRSVDSQHNNQRLEFLGDRVLGLVIAELVYDHFPDEREGDLAIRHAALVCGASLTHVARTLNLGEELELSEGEDMNDGRNNVSNLEDACEALIGAYYLDGGLEKARDFIVRHWTPLLHQDLTPPKDAKTLLQEWAQAQGLGLPSYHDINCTGPDHAPEFTIEVRVHNHEAEQAFGSSKREAQQRAAQLMLDRYA